MAGKRTRATIVPASGQPFRLIDTRVIYCGDNLDQLRKLPDGCVDLIYIDPPALSAAEQSGHHERHVGRVHHTVAVHVRR